MCLAALAVAACGGGEARPEPDGLVAIANPAQPPFDPTRLLFHSFGDVPFGDQVSHSFRFQNTDATPVTITQVQSSCGCSVAQLRRVDAKGTVLEHGDPDSAGALLTVPPRGLCEIEMRLDTRLLRPTDGDKLVQVRVATDSPRRPWITLEAHVKVDVGFLCVPQSLELARVPQGVGGRGSVLIRQDGERRLELTGVEEAPPGFDVALEEDLRFPSARQWQLLVDVPPGHPAGAVQGTVRIATRDAAGVAGRPISVPVFARIVADIVVQPSQAVLRARGADGRLQQEVRVESLVDGLLFRIESAEIAGFESERIAVEFEPQDPDGRRRARAWIVRVYADGDGLRGAVRGTVHLLLDDPQNPRLELPYVAVLP